MPPSAPAKFSTRNKINATLMVIGVAIFVEAVVYFTAQSMGHGRVIEVLRWISSSQVFLIMFFAYLWWSWKHKAKYYLPGTTSMSPGGKRRLFAFFIILMLFGLFWAFGVYTAIIYGSLASSAGVDANASIQSYELVHTESVSRTQEIEQPVSTLQQADLLEVTFGYDNRTTTIAFDKTDPAFGQVYNAATHPGTTVHIRYMRAVPAIMLPVQDLN